MADTLRIKRRTSGGAGAPSALLNAEIAYNEVDDSLWYGKGNSGGNATSIIKIGAPLPLSVANGGTGSTTAAAAPWVETAGDTMTGKLLISFADDATSQMTVRGTSNELRFLTSAGGTQISSYAGSSLTTFTLTASAPAITTGAGNASFQFISTGQIQINAPSGQPAAVTLVAARQWQVTAQPGGGDFAVLDNTAGATRLLITSTGACYNATGSWNALSDERTKRDVHDYQRGLDEILDMRPVSFRYNGQYGTVDDDVEQFGMIAQELEAIIPEFVNTREWTPPDGGQTVILKAVDVGRLIFPCINAIRELSEQIKELAARVAALEAL